MEKIIGHFIQSSYDKPIAVSFGNEKKQAEMEKGIHRKTNAPFFQF